jgi:hypothetical protein
LLLLNSLATLKGIDAEAAATGLNDAAVEVEIHVTAALDLPLN